VFANELSEAVKAGKADGDIRIRYEGVDQDGKQEDAAAKTIRLRLGYTTGEFNGFQFHVDVETIHKLFDDDYNSTNNGNTDYPVVADPVGSELNQAYVTYTGLKNSIFKLGRQRIILDNARFIGNVGWRQNEQTYDAYTYVFTGIENGTLILSNVQRVNRIFGEYHDSPLKANFDSNAFVIHYNHKFSFGSLTAYGHFIELQNPELVALSHKNLGLRFSGKKEKFLYAFEYAKQSDYSDGMDGIDADYSLVELGANLGKITLKGGYEVLGGDGTWGFFTPLATLHAFNGWADKFLSTPANGIQDMYFMISTKIKAGSYPIVMKAIYHSFESDSSVAFAADGETALTFGDYGTEIDALVKVVLSKQSSVLLKYANYSADNLATDTTKLWLMGSYKF
jgi:hypothetical protein